MLPYTNRAKTHDTNENFELARSCMYDLQSVVVHVGSMDTGKSKFILIHFVADRLGHYYSYSRAGNQVRRFTPYFFFLPLMLSSGLSSMTITSR